MTQPRKLPPVPVPSAEVIQWALAVSGLCTLSAGAFLFAIPLGLAALGFSLLVLAFMSSAAGGTSS